MLLGITGGLQFSQFENPLPLISAKMLTQIVTLILHSQTIKMIFFLCSSRPTKYETLQQALIQEYLKTIRARQRGFLSHAKVSPNNYLAGKASFC